MKRDPSTESAKSTESTDNKEELAKIHMLGSEYEQQLRILRLKNAVLDKVITELGNDLYMVTCEESLAAAPDLASHLEDYAVARYVYNPTVIIDTRGVCFSVDNPHEMQFQRDYLASMHDECVQARRDHNCKEEIADALYHALLDKGAYKYSHAMEIIQLMQNSVNNPSIYSKHPRSIYTVNEILKQDFLTQYCPTYDIRLACLQPEYWDYVTLKQPFPLMIMNTQPQQ